MGCVCSSTHKLTPQEKEFMKDDAKFHQLCSEVISAPDNVYSSILHDARICSRLIESSRTAPLAIYERRELERMKRTMRSTYVMCSLMNKQWQ